MIPAERCVPECMYVLEGATTMRYVELAIAAIAMLGVAVAQDLVKVDAAAYKVEFENDQVRVLRSIHGFAQRRRCMSISQA